MNKLLGRKGILSLICLLVLTLTACMDGASLLVLNVDTPKDGATVNTPAVKVSGHLGGSEASGARVSVNNTDITVLDRKFATDVPLTEGKNVIHVAAKAGTTDLTQQVAVTYAPAK